MDKSRVVGRFEETLCKCLDRKWIRDGVNMESNNRNKTHAYDYNYEMSIN